MTITYHPDLIQGTEAWLAARCGVLTASEIKLIITPTLKSASNEKERAHVWELAAQRLTQYVEPSYIGDDMLRGMEDEIEARGLYHQTFAPVTEMGFITNDRWGFTIGASPDGLVGDDGQIECKSRRQKFQLETIATRAMPDDYWIQVQTALLVSERAWCDFISYSGGLPMIVLRVFPDEKTQAAIVDAAAKFEERVALRIAEYRDTLASDTRLIPTERRIEMEMHL